MSTNLERNIKRYYESQNLPPEEIEGLRSLIEAGPSRPNRHVGRWVAAAALAVIALSLVLAVRHQRQATAAITEQIARETAREHNQHLGVEVAASNYATIRAKMRSLDFTPVEPSSFAEMPMRLLGGRYVSLAGQPAVQLEMLDAHGERCTLIQARPSDRLQAIRAKTTHQVDGLQIDIWKEKGLVMVLARPA